MTSADPLLPVPEDDALDAAASAVVDGVATPEEAASVAAAPDGGARVAALRAVAGAVGSGVGAQRPAAADAGLAAALAAFDDRGGVTASGDAGDGDGDVVRRLPPAPPPPSRSGGFPRWMAVAAALLLVVGIGAFAAAVLSDGESPETFTAAGPQQDLAEPPAASTTFVPPASAAPAAGAAAGRPSSTRPPNVLGTEGAPTTARAPVRPPPPVVNGGELGREDEVEALAQRAAAALDGVPDTGVAAQDAALPSEVQACASAAPAASGEALGALRYRAVATYQGTAAVVLAFDRAGGQPPRLLLVLSRAGCSVLASTHF